MVFFRNIILAASAIIGATAAPTALATRDGPQTFYIEMMTTNAALRKYNGWQIETYHTGAGFADPVFAVNGTPAYLNNTQIQFDIYEFPFSLISSGADTNYARWEPASIAAGCGTSGFVNTESSGIQIDDENFGGWIVCEWFHGTNAPQLFEAIKGFDTDPQVLPASCASVGLYAKYI